MSSCCYLDLFVNNWTALLLVPFQRARLSDRGAVQSIRGIHWFEGGSGCRRHRYGLAGSRHIGSASCKALQDDLLPLQSDVLTLFCGELQIIIGTPGRIADHIRR